MGGVGATTWAFHNIGRTKETVPGSSPGQALSRVHRYNLAGLPILCNSYTIRHFQSPCELTTARKHSNFLLIAVRCLPVHQ